MPDLNLLAAAVLAGADPRLSDIDRWVLHAVASNEHTRTLDALAATCPWCREQVFGSVGRLEALGHLEKGAIR